MRITWTDHALQRAAERLDPTRPVATPELSRVGAGMGCGQTRAISIAGVVYVCRRRWDSITVLTVYPVEFI